MSVTETTNHQLKKQDQGDQDWHIPLNDTLDILDTQVLVKDDKANRPNAGEEDRVFLARDTKELFYDDGNTWTRMFINPSDIDPADLGFDTATQQELDNHVTDTSNPHQVDPSQIDAVSNEGNSPAILSDTLSNRPSASSSNNNWLFISTDTGEIFKSDGSGWVLFAKAPGQIQESDLPFDPALQSDLDSHVNDFNNPHQVDADDLNVVGKYSESVSLTADTPQNIQHDLGTTDLIVQFWDSTGEKQEGISAQLVDQNNIEIEASIDIDGTVVVNG